MSQHAAVTKEVNGVLIGFGLVEDHHREVSNKAAQPRSSEKNAASRAGQTLRARWAVGGVYYNIAKRRGVTVAKGLLCVLIASCAVTF